MKKSLIATFCVAGVVAATAAWAGMKGGTVVAVDAVNRRAEGSLGNARNSTDNNQYIGCRATANNNGTVSALCWAQGAVANSPYVTCQTTVPQMVNVASALNGDSYVKFAWDAGGLCTYIIVENDSWYAPKNP
jgi:hypothetical protein